MSLPLGELFPLLSSLVGSSKHPAAMVDPLFSYDVCVCVCVGQTRKKRRKKTEGGGSRMLLHRSGFLVVVAFRSDK